MDSSKSNLNQIGDLDKNKTSDEPCSSRMAGKKQNIWQQVNMSGIESVPESEKDDALLHMEGVTVFDQQQLERGLMNQIDQAISQSEREAQKKRSAREIKNVVVNIRDVKASIAQATRVLTLVKENDKDTRKRLDSIRCQKINKEKQLQTLQAKLKRLERLAGIQPTDDTEQEDDIDDNEASSSAITWALTGQTEIEREKLIRSGDMTPFGSMIEEKQEGAAKPEKRKLFLDSGFNDFLSSQSKPDEAKAKKKVIPIKGKDKQDRFQDEIKKGKRKINGLKAWLRDEQTTDEGDQKSVKPALQDSASKQDESISDQGSGNENDEYKPSAEELKDIEKEDLEDDLVLDDIAFGKKKIKRPRYDAETGLSVFDYSDEDTSSGTKRGKKMKLGKGSRSHSIMDDAKLVNYKHRLEAYRKTLEKEKLTGLPPDKHLGGGFRVPGQIWSKLYKHQKTAVRWLWELHSQQVGGILGDEMGLGKTIEVISFLAGLAASKIRSRGVPGYGYEGLGPVLIITPTTVMQQWVREIHAWWPPSRVAILHESGTYNSSRAQLIENIAQSNGVLVTSYERARINIDMLLEHGWHYLILDEGHKIRNPDAAVTSALKLFRTPHRLILSGSPVQNNLRELWSLFDFIFPGKLGTLPVFMEQFSVPIVQGGYSNATEVQVHTAYKCACTLRKTISPYLLRRMKCDVQENLGLPGKSEQVLFCRLSDHQVEVYKNYLESDTVYSILCRETKVKVFTGLIMLRKICNHPDLHTGGPKIMVGEAMPDANNKRSYGYYKRSGKMLVVESLLKIWKKQEHKVLLFSQSKAMVDILDKFAKSRGYSYLVMHGGTSVQSRQPLIKRFNEDPSIFVFIMTTRVGGLGINLTGANRVIIYDPDWNPSTDAQAQERSWRIGQDRDVTIYRLLTSGTIEEKIYHRQIFKQFLTNRILKDPRQRRFFKSNDLHELFTFTDHTSSGDKKKDQSSSTENIKTETGAIFAGTGSEIYPSHSIRNKNRTRSTRGKSSEASCTAEEISDITIKTEYSKKNYQNVPILKIHRSILDRATEPSTSKRLPDKSIHNDQTISPVMENSNHSSSDHNMDELAHTEDRNAVHESTKSSLSKPEEEVCNPQNNVQSDQSAIISTEQDFINNNSDALDFTTIVPVLDEDTQKLLSHSEQTATNNCENNICVDGNNDEKTKILKEKPPVSSLKESLRRAKMKFEERRKVEEGKNVKKIGKKKRRRKYDAAVDGEIISNVDSIEKYRPSSESSKELQKRDRRATDDYVLKKLFKSAGVHSAMQHNTIMESAHPDFALVEVEAERVAKEAVRNLRLSRKQYSFPSGTSSKPRFGQKNMNSSPKSIPKDESAVIITERENDAIFKAPNLSSTAKYDGGENSSAPLGLSSNLLLASMRRRNHENIHKVEEQDMIQDNEENELFGYSLSQNSANYVPLPNPTEHDELMTELRNFIAFQCDVDGQARTLEIMQEFRNKITPTHAPVFKSLLQHLCHVTTVPGTQDKVWTLKEEFR